MTNQMDTETLAGRIVDATYLVDPIGWGYALQLADFLLDDCPINSMISFVQWEQLVAAGIVSGDWGK